MIRDALFVPTLSLLAIVTAAPATHEATPLGEGAELVGAPAINSTLDLLAIQEGKDLPACENPTSVGNSWCPMNFCSNIRCSTQACEEYDGDQKCKIKCYSGKCAKDGMVIDCVESKYSIGASSKKCTSYCAHYADCYYHCEPKKCKKWKTVSEGFRGDTVNYFSSCSSFPGEWLLNFCPEPVGPYEKPEPPPCDDKCKACKACDKACQEANKDNMSPRGTPTRGFGKKQKACYNKCNKDNDCGFGPKGEDDIFPAGVHKAKNMGP